MLNQLKRWVWVLVFMLDIVVAVCCLNFIREITYSFSKVYNTTNEANFLLKHPIDYEFIRQNPNSEKLKWFKSEIEDIIANIDNDLGKAEKIRQWARQQQGAFEAAKWCASCGPNSENPIELLEMQRDGVPGACRRFAYILTGALVSAEMDARWVHIAQDFSDDTFNHCLVEVWIDSLSKWVLIDSDYDTFYLIDGVPASMIEMHYAVQNEEFDRIGFDRAGSIEFPIPKVYKENENDKEVTELVKSFEHIYISLTNAFFDGYEVNPFSSKNIRYLHFVGSETNPYPTHKKMIAFVFLFFSVSLNAVIAILWIIYFLKNYSKNKF